jgi:prepilin-type N-terminal cleavage/methylation domain-containing protein
MHASQKSGKRKAESGHGKAKKSRFQLSALSSQLSPRGFTLVELLVVIVIISMLAAMTTGAIVIARAAARRALIKTEIGQLAMALERYKNEVGEYPPDFSHLDEDNNSAVDTEGETACKAVLTRHLRRRFPRFQGDWDDAVTAVNTNYSLNISQLDPAGALAFWLGGLPETASTTKLAGFSANPANPFQAGLPRTTPFYDFDPALLDDQFRYRPNLPAGLPQTPFVYFRSSRHNVSGAHTYLFTYTDSTGANVAVTRYWQHTDTTLGYAVPYRSGVASAGEEWRAEGTYQIISGGLDGTLSNPTDVTDATTFPVTITGDNFTEGDYDNQTNFADGKLEDELQ